MFGVIIGLGFLVFIHELGHFFTAKMCKVKILIFSLGFGPDLIWHVYKGTRYSIKAIPFGGFISMAGENPDEAVGADGEYLSLKWYKKVLISFAGPFSNYILSIFLFSFVFSIWGASIISMSSPIGSITKNSVVVQAGLIPGDKIKSVVRLKNEFEKRTTFAIKRGKYSFDLNMLVGKHLITTDRGMIDMVPLVIKMKPSSTLQSVYLGVKTSIMQTVMTVMYLVNKIVSFEKPEISGPIGVMQLMANATKSGMQHYLKLLAIISVALGLFNLLPIPMVDGGMVILFCIEGMIGKRISTKVLQVYNTIGLVFIVAIFIFATYSDFLKLGICRLFAK
jgi:regulator of sigma E protease